MKLRVLLAALALFLLPAFSLAGTPEDAALAAMQSAHPAASVAVCDAWGDSAAAVLAMDDARILCVAEKKNGAWQVTIDNPAAIPAGATPLIVMDCDTSLFWQYTVGSTVIAYHAEKQEGTWGTVNYSRHETYSNGYSEELSIYWREGQLRRYAEMLDENGNILSSTAYPPIPAAWMEADASLARFSAGLYGDSPEGEYFGMTYPRDALVKAAAQVMPDYTFLNGYASPDQVAFLMEQPDGKRVFVGCESQDNIWFLTESTPLPDGTVMGYENFTNSLVIDGLLVNIFRFADGRWGVGFIYNDRGNGEDETMFRLGPCWASATDVSMGQKAFFGTHAWNDITRIDWSTLPRTLEEAVSRLDRSDWATVSNPNPADRLHLRAEPSRDAASLGKYYNGTPVQVLEQKGDWTKVTIFGCAEGWMMTKYLTFGSAMDEVEPAWPVLFAREGESGRMVYRQPDQKSPRGQACWSQLVVLGLVGDEWYHVLFDDGLSGYVPQGEWWPGNG